MNGPTALDTINSWRRILIEGDPASIGRMLDDVERKLGEKGWTRETGMEAKLRGPSGREDAWRCFVGGPERGPRLILGLNRVSDRRVRGGTYSLLDGPPDMTTDDVARVVEDVIRDVLTPCASEHGLKVTIPRLGAISHVPPRTLTSLRLFSDAAAGSWPLSPEQERLWRRFIINVCREDTMFDIDELLDWLVANGWSSEQARLLMDKFQNDVSLISEYQDEAGV
jgi:hypothetical protein